MSLQKQNGVIKMTEEQNTVKLEGILSRGYGIIPKLVMLDVDLTIEAKAIYAYLASYAGNGESAFPSIKKICYDLQINEKRFNKHKKSLLDKGYIEVTKQRKGGAFASNVYTIKQFVKPTTQNGSTVPTPQNGSTQNGSLQNGSTQNGGTNNNSVTNNSTTNNNDNNLLQQPADPEPSKINFIQTWEKSGFGIMPPLTMEKLDGWVKDFDGNEEIVVKAIEVANDYGKRYYNYVKTILTSWEDKGVKTLADIDALEQQRATEFEAKKQKSSKQPYSKKPVRSEKLPDWAKKDAEPVKETPVDEQAEMEFEERLKRIRNSQN